MWQPPNQPPVGFVPYAPPVAVRTLTAPIWERQSDEPLAAWTAFQGWLAPGAPNAPPGNWAEASARIAEPSRVTLEGMSREWSWEARARARAEAGAPAPPTVEERAYAALARERDRVWLEFEILELKKLDARARGVDTSSLPSSDPLRMPSVLSPRELIQLRRAEGALEVARSRAGILEKMTKGPGDDRPLVNWDLLDDEELENYRRLREKASA